MTLSRIYNWVRKTVSNAKSSLQGAKVLFWSCSMVLTVLISADTFITLKKPPAGRRLTLQSLNTALICADQIGWFWQFLQIIHLDVTWNLQSYPLPCNILNSRLRRTIRVIFHILEREFEISWDTETEKELSEKPLLIGGCRLSKNSHTKEKQTSGLKHTHCSHGPYGLWGRLKIIFELIVKDTKRVKFLLVSYNTKITKAQKDARKAAATTLT